PGRLPAAYRLQSAAALLQPFSIAARSRCRAAHLRRHGRLSHDAPGAMHGPVRTVRAHAGDRFGAERTLLFVLILIGVGTALRAGGDTLVLFAGTTIAGAGIAMGNVLLPSVVKRDFPDRVAAMTGLFTMS